MYLPFQVWGCGALAAASFMHFHQVTSWTAAACEAFLRIFALVIYGFSSWLGTLGGHDAFARVRIMLLSVIAEGSIAMCAMVLVVCFCIGSGSVQEPVASTLAVCWNHLLHVLGLRIVVQGRGDVRHGDFRLPGWHRRHLRWTCPRSPSGFSRALSF